LKQSGSQYQLTHVKRPNFSNDLLAHRWGKNSGKKGTFPSDEEGIGPKSSEGDGKTPGSSEKKGVAETYMGIGGRIEYQSLGQKGSFPEVQIFKNISIPSSV